MKLEEVLEEYPGHRIGYRHNPDHFYPNSFKVEVRGKRKLVVAKVKRHVGKRFRVVGVLKVKK